MVSDPLAGWNPVVYIFAALVYIIVMHHLDRYEKRIRSRKPATDGECLARMARKRGCGEFDIFRASTENWNIPESKIEDDFRDYLLRGWLPYYVRDYIRRNKTEIANGGPQFPAGGSLPSSWSA